MLKNSYLKITKKTNVDLRNASLTNNIPDVVSIDLDGTLFLYKDGAMQINPTFFAVFHFCKTKSIPVYFTTARCYQASYNHMSSEFAYGQGGVYTQAIAYLVDYVKINFDLDVTVLTYVSDKEDKGEPGSFYKKHHGPFEAKIAACFKFRLKWSGWI